MIYVYVDLLWFNDEVSCVAIILEHAFTSDTLELLSSCFHSPMLRLEVSLTTTSLQYNGNHKQGFGHAGQVLTQLNYISSLK